MLYVYTMEYNSAIRKKAILPFVATLMDLSLSKISQTEKDKYSMISLIRESKKPNSSKQSKTVVTRGLGE